MQMIWNRQTVNWFVDASEYTGYNKKMAELLFEHFEGCNSFCDMGCGLALVDYELEKMFNNEKRKIEITCVDIAHDIIEIVKEQSIQNNSEIRAICCDGKKNNQKWDAVMALFHGGENIIESYYEKANKVLVIAVFSSKIGEFGPKKNKIPKGGDVSMMKEKLDSLGISYELIETALEHGQPFRSRKEAADFVKMYTTSLEAVDLNQYLDINLKETGEKEFPYYLPKQKKFGVFVLKK